MNKSTILLNNIIGKKFNLWTILEYYPGSKDRKVRSKVLAKCDCGTVREVVWQDIKKNKSKCCGCVSNAKKHALSGSSEYQAWSDMKIRCTNPKNKHFQDYGGRGITFCSEWKDFKEFYKSMGEKPTPLHSLDRINNDAGYSPENCKWSTPQEQVLNRRIKSSPPQRLRCANCGMEYYEHGCRIKSSKHCSYACRKHIIKTKCIKCEKEIINIKSNIKKYCSRKCYFQHKRDGRQG